MNSYSNNKNELLENGFSIINDFYSSEEINAIIDLISQADSSNSTFRKTSELFAIRQFFKELPNVFDLVFSEKLKFALKELVGEDFFMVKSIYFDKPETSNWYVSFHQDLTISVDKKLEIDNFGPWTTKQNQFAVQPPIEILENIITLRIHLDDTDENNGALRVIPKSHKKKIFRPENIEWETEKESTCMVDKGGIMFMKPLILHGSNRTLNSKRRRVIHIEFSNENLPEGLNWAEKRIVF